MIRQLKQPSDTVNTVRPATESDYSYAAVQGTREQPEQVNFVAPNEGTYAEIKDRELQPYQFPTTSNQASPKPTEAAVNHDIVYSAVTKKRTMSNTAIVSHLEPSEEMLKPAPAAQISVPPVKPAPYKSKNSL